MSLSFSDEQLSDEEVFFGKLSLKEIKKHILWSDHKRNPKNRYNSNDEIRIIETHSEPNLNAKENDSLNLKTVSNSSLSPNTPTSYSKWEIKQVDDSFLKVEKIVTDLCLSQENEENVNKLDNTLDIIDYILKNGGNSPSVVEDKVKNDNTQKDEPLSLSPNKEISQSPTYYTPIKNEINTIKNDVAESILTPSTNHKQKEIFKTPRNPLLQKKASATSLKKTPCKSNAYQHIASPVASYIKNCPVAPLVKDVKPSKPLPGPSSIPKFVKVPPVTKSNSKENINLPSIAYKSAKKTKVIDAPDEEKIPMTQWMKKITSSLPKPVVLKHNHREINIAKRILGSRQEDSFADLSLRQADVSVCTKKSAFNKPKKPL